MLFPWLPLPLTYGLVYWANLRSLLPRHISTPFMPLSRLYNKKLSDWNGQTEKAGQPFLFLVYCWEGIILKLIIKMIYIYNFISVSTLQHTCRDTILQYVRKENVEKLPLPTKLKEFLRYEVWIVKKHQCFVNFYLVFTFMSSTVHVSHLFFVFLFFLFNIF